MPRLLEIAQLGHPVIRQKASLVDDVKNVEIQCFIDDLLLTVDDANGVGIAAPQVYESKRIFIISSKPNPRYPYAPTMAPTVMINPEIIWQSLEIEKDWEGCLSLPGIRALVPRTTSIKAKYISREGETIEAQYDGFIARVFQHELDHLDGIVFIDRVETTQDVVMEKEWQRIIANR